MRNQLRIKKVIDMDYDYGPVERLVSEYHRRSGIELKPQCWLNGDDGEGGQCGQAESYCPGCAEKIVKEIKKKQPEAEVMVDGGWDPTESDYVERCNKCDRLLEGNLTASGAEPILEGRLSVDDYQMEGMSDEDLYELELLFGHGSDYEGEVEKDREELARRLLEANRREKLELGIRKPG